MNDKIIIRILFYVAGLYDGLLGVIFVLAPKQALDICDVDFAANAGYLQFPAALLIVFAWMFFAIARKPLANRNLIPYTIGLKVAYCAVVVWQWSRVDLDTLWKPFLVCDAIFAVLLAWAYIKLARARQPGPPRAAQSQT